ncbi:MAG: DUF998 domain-containing protein [Boseongicola sp.]
MSTLFVRTGIVLLITAAVVGNLLTHADYNLISNRLSELGGQGMPNAWIMQFGFFAFGAGSIIAAALKFRRLPASRSAIAVFGASMVLVSLFPARSIWPEMPFDALADDLHSIFASVAGTAFGLACAARLFLRSGHIGDWLSWIGLVASVAIPLFMLQYPEFAGLPQRVMFAISAIWLWREFRPS